MPFQGVLKLLALILQTKRSKQLKIFRVVRHGLLSQRHRLWGMELISKTAAIWPLWDLGIVLSCTIKLFVGVIDLDRVNLYMRTLYYRKLKKKFIRMLSEKKKRRKR